MSSTVDLHPRLLTWLVVLVGSLIGTASALFADPPIQAELNGLTLEVSGLEPGAQVVFSEIRRWRAEFYPRTLHRAEIQAADSDGIAAIELAEAPPRKFIAFVVELDSGRFDVVTLEGSPVRAVAMPVNSLQNGPGSQLDRLTIDHQQIELLLVRPGVGAWRLSEFDGGFEDRSPPSDGVILTELASMEPVGESGPPPEEYAKDDLLIQVAPRTMEYFVARIVR